MATKSRTWPEFSLHERSAGLSRLGPWVVCGLAGVAILGIALIGASRSLERSNPELARTLFPLNTEAVINQGTALLRREAPDADLPPIEPLARGLLRTHAGDARLYSLIGEIHRRAGAEDQANIAFDQAFALSKIEINALHWTAQRALDRGDFATALDRLDTLFRRWPHRVVPLAPLVLGVFSDPQRYPLLLARLQADPPWRGGLIAAWSRNPDALVFLTHLMQDLATGPHPAGRGEIATLLSGLLASGQPDLAYRTFVMTLSPAEREAAGYIYNGRFQLPPGNRPFDWQIRNQPGMMATVQSESDPGASGLRVRFSNAPARDLSIGQMLMLPAGDYELEFSVAASDARLPKDLLWRIVCQENQAMVAEAPVAPGTYKATASRTPFTIPDAGCPLQTLQLVTKAMVDNWNERYGGTVIFDDFRIEAVE